MPKISDVLVERNPWWKGEFEVIFKERELYEKIKKFMGMRQMIALTGLRRVGKTTIMLKMAQDAIEGGLPPGNIMYFPFDEFRNIEIRDVVKTYEELLEKDIRKGRFLIFFDEIQKLSGWEDQLKSLYDSLGESVKIIISGSESLFIKKKSKETLGGRMFEFKAETLSFAEFLAFRQVKFEPPAIYAKELANIFVEFSHTHGFPELAGIKDKEIIKKYIKESIIDKVVYKDIPKLFKVSDPAIIESLLNIFMEEPGQLVDLSSLASDLLITRQTLSKYLSYLEQSFLIKKLYNFSRSRRKTERKLKKYYPAIISTELIFKGDDLSKSKVFEWLVVTQLKAEFFWRDPYKNEVDAILTDGKITPIEIKYGKIDFTGLVAFMKKFKIYEGFIVSYKIEEKQKINGKTISVVPAFKFLLEPSHVSSSFQTPQQPV